MDTEDNNVYYNWNLSSNLNPWSSITTTIDYPSIIKMLEYESENTLYTMCSSNSKNIEAFDIKFVDETYGRFIYEATLLNSLPEDFESLFISYLNDENSENVEEIELIKLTDTSIVFSTSTRLPDDLTKVVIQCN